MERQSLVIFIFVHFVIKDAEKETQHGKENAAKLNDNHLGEQLVAKPGLDSVVCVQVSLGEDLLVYLVSHVVFIFFLLIWTNISRFGHFLGHHSVKIVVLQIIGELLSKVCA